MKLSNKAAAVTAAAAVSAGLAVSLAGAAGASNRTPTFGGSGSSNCASGIYAGYCSTQESGTGLYVAAGWYGRIVGVKHPQASDAEFFWFADGSSSAANNDKYAEFAPRGVASNKVMAEVRGRVVLVTATGAADQKWVYNEAGSVWTNVATGDELEATTNGGPIRAVKTPTSASASAWTFVVP